MDAIKVRDLYDLTHTRAAEMLGACEYPWEALGKIKATVLAIGQTLDPETYDHPQESVWIAKSASIAPTASITAARSPPLSSAYTPSMVVPPGEQTASLSAPGCSPVSCTILAAPMSVCAASS